MPSLNEEMLKRIDVAYRRLLRARTEVALARWESSSLLPKDSIHQIDSGIAELLAKLWEARKDFTQ